VQNQENQGKNVPWDKSSQNRKESWDKEVGFRLEECKEIIFEDDVFPAGENYVVILIEVISLYTICEHLIV
jgi:hypothetical protein